MSGYKILPNGTKVSVLPRGFALPVEGVVKGHELNPNRKPGIARVTYKVFIHPAYPWMDVPANKVVEHVPV